MESSYRGEATILFDGNEVGVYARLVKVLEGGLPTWHGQLDAQGADADLWDVFQADATQLRLPDGQVGTFISTNFRVGQDSLQIKGSGRAPF